MVLNLSMKSDNAVYLRIMSVIGFNDTFMCLDDCK